MNDPDEFLRSLNETKEKAKPKLTPGAVWFVAWGVLGPLGIAVYFIAQAFKGAICQ